MVGRSEQAKEQALYLPACQPFKLGLHWLQGQAFRWKECDGWFYGFVGGKLIKVRQAKGGIEFHSKASEESLRAHVSNYFRLDQAITPVHDAMRHAGLGDLVDKHGGMRILCQDPWECLVSYACSRRNSVGGIKKIVDALATHYGESQTLDGVKRHSFPSAKNLVKVSQKELEGLGFGLNRAALISLLAKDVAQGKLDLDALACSSYKQAREKLMEYPGIGPKISACVCLFSLDMDEAFPVDRHIREGLERRFKKEHARDGKNAEILDWARKRFGNHPGYAGQLLFLEGRYPKDG